MSANGEKKMMEALDKWLGKGSVFFSNLIIAASVTLFFLFVERTGAIPWLLTALLKILAIVFTSDPFYRRLLQCSLVLPRETD